MTAKAYLGSTVAGIAENCELSLSTSLKPEGTSNSAGSSGASEISATSNSDVLVCSVGVELLEPNAKRETLVDFTAKPKSVTPVR